MHLKMSSGNFRAICLGLDVLTKIRAWINNHAYCFMWDVIAHAYPDFKSGLDKLIFPWTKWPPFLADDIFKRIFLKE